MKQNSNRICKKLMEEFARNTGLEPENSNPKRYLWTDAFAVCNYLGLYRRTNNKVYLYIALRLVNQVHHTLGKQRNDNPKNGWISGLDEETGEKHPTKGGLRIGKEMNERMSEETIQSSVKNGTGMVNTTITLPNGCMLLNNTCQSNRRQ